MAAPGIPRQTPFAFRSCARSAGGALAWGPKRLSEAPPEEEEYEDWRQASRIDAVYTPAGIPAPNFDFERSTWVRWILELFDKGGQSREEWTYFAIPSSGYGAQSTNYGRKLFDYDSAGRQNETTCAGGTAAKTTFNAMGWPVQEELGTSTDLVVTDKREYHPNEYHPNGTPMKWTQLVDDETPDTDRVVEYTHDFRHRLTLVKSTGEQDGGDPWIHLRVLTYDNRDLRLVEEEYHTSVTGSHRIARRENAWDAMGKRYQPGVCKVNETTGEDDPRHSFFDNQWRPIEERVDDAVMAHFAWSPFDRWSLIRRKRTVTTPLDETLFLLKDYLDPAAIINTSGAVQERFAFDAFGPHRFLDPDFDPAGGAFDWNFLFHAEFRDQESGLYNYGYRYYHPDLGRWLSRDAIGEEGGMKLYRIINNNTTNWIDVLGLLTYKEAFEHYKNGEDDPNDPNKRVPKRISFDDINTDTVSADSFPTIAKALKDCKPGTYHIEWKSKEDNLPFTTSGDQKLFLGDISLKLTGTLTIYSDKKWKFIGEPKSFDDLYDFNKSNHRGAVGELLTFFGRKTKGKQFWIEIRGVKKIEQSGHCSEKSNPPSESYYYLPDIYYSDKYYYFPYNHNHDYDYDCYLEQ